MADVRRPITAAVRRRAWGELGVRPWTVLALLLALTAVIVAVSRWNDWRYENYVIRHGTRVTAEVVNIGLGTDAHQGTRDETLNVELQYTPPDSSSPLNARNILPRKPGQIVKLKDKLPVNIDPAHPGYWTERTEPSPLGLAMITPLLCGGLALLCGVVALARRNAAVRAYGVAEPMRATVQRVRQSPLAPFYKLLTVSLDTGTDRRVRECYWPNTAGTVHPKQAVEVLVAKRRTFASVAYGQAPAVLPGEALEDPLRGQSE